MLLESVINVEEFTTSWKQSNYPLICFKQQLDASQTLLKQAFYQHSPINEIIDTRAKLVDKLLEAAWDHLAIPFDQPLALIATGGYGRNELHPHSDIDILILGDNKNLKQHENAIEKLITFLWDIGLKIGQSVRNLDECVTLAKEDVTIYTNLLDARKILGSDALFTRLLEVAAGANTLWSNDAFFSAKIVEQKLRHKKYGHSSYNLEPNIKDGPGGLRDIHTVFWVAKQKFSINNTHDLVAQKFLTEEEYTLLEMGQQYLWQIRTALHHLASRQEERLLFDNQKHLADLFKYEDSSIELGIEQFMKKYYRTVKELNELNDMLLQYFQEAILNPDEEKHIVRLNDRFQTVNDYIEVSHGHVFQESPTALIEMFLLMAKNQEIKGVRAATIRLIRQNRHFVNDQYREDEAVRKSFIDIFRQEHNIAESLRLMSRYGLLEKYLPEFGFLVGKMQYDLYHVYTVDRHLIAVLQNIYNFTLDKYQHDYPLFHELIKKTPQLELLYLAGLFHDIGKGHGGDHSEIGAELATRFCLQHYLEETQAQLVTWLVENHLLMSYTAQRLDIYDPEVIEHFARKVDNKKRLDYLYLLTCADIIATNESLWNNWRASLLRDLYTRARAYFLDQKVRERKTTAHINQIKREAMKEIADPDEKRISGLWPQWGKQYFLHHSPQKIAWHTQAILQHHQVTQPLILISTYLNEGGTEIFIYVKDQENVFAHSTAILDKLNLNIVEAQIITTKDGFTLDSYIVIDREGKPITNDTQIDHMTQYIQQQFLNNSKSIRIPKRRLSRRQRHFTYPTKVNFQRDNKHGRTRLEIISPDRPGLLARLGRAFKDCEINLHYAKITTMGDRVEDFFFITDPDHQPIDDEATQTKLSKSIRQYLDTPL